MPSVVRDGEASTSFSLNPKADWVHLGTHITHIPDALYPWNEEHVREIRALYDPDFFPIFRRMVYRSAAGGIHVFRHHGVAWHNPMLPSPDPLVFVAPFPSVGYGSDWGWKYGHCNSVFWYERSMKSRPEWCQKAGLPGPIVPWSRDMVRMAEETSRRTRIKAIEILEAQEAERKKIAKEQAEEAAYRQKGEAPYQRRLIDSLGVDDYRQMMAPPSYRSDERRPFVHLSSK